MDRFLTRRHLLRLVGGGAALAWLANPRAGVAASDNETDWAALNDFDARFLDKGDRVVDLAYGDERTVSEAQAYMLFFCLAGNRRDRFEQVLRWTQDNLCQGDISLHLPAWLWGKHTDGTYGVLDANSASDADLWMAYVLLEAGRLWNMRRYTALGAILAARILRDESAVLPGLGPCLMPGRSGFIEPTAWRLNPSYGPLFILRRLSGGLLHPAWEPLRASNVQVLRASSPAGFAPDWIWYSAEGGDRGRFVTDTQPPQTALIGSYDAIRVYLWLGMTSPQDPDRAELLQHFLPMAQEVVVRRMAPRTVAVMPGQGRFSGESGPAALASALLPFCLSLGQTEAVTILEQQLAMSARPDGYYDAVMALFASGWRARRFAFDPAGQLLTPWANPS